MRTWILNGTGKEQAWAGVTERGDVGDNLLLYRHSDELDDASRKFKRAGLKPGAYRSNWERKG
jgi:hypothetical protein